MYQGTSNYVKDKRYDLRALTNIGLLTIISVRSSTSQAHKQLSHFEVCMSMRDI